ncbi:MAG: hypothetical protein M3454_10815 [Actinomycetota bacterium]|nr:hypothetical protein [Actinomycetota bacterium]
MAILAAVVWVGLGRVLSVEILALTPLYVGEVVSVYAFGLSWIAKGRDLLKGVPILKKALFLQVI